MKAAVLHAYGEPPRYEEFAEPSAAVGEVELVVRASALTWLSRGLARGVHYAASGQLPSVVGSDGIGTVSGGGRVYADRPRPPWGMMAERTVVPASACVPVPVELDDLTAATVPNAAISSWLALARRARLQPGETVLVLGATGIAGSLALPIARHLGAGRVVAAGRSLQKLEELRASGADAVIALGGTDAEVTAALSREHAEHPLDVIVDYLWGHPAELAFGVLTGRGPVSAVHRTRYVSVGTMAGPVAQVPSATFRSSGLELIGSGIGSVSMTDWTAAIPRVLELARSGRVRVATERVPLAEVARVWGMPESAGRRVVLVP